MTTSSQTDAALAAIFDVDGTMVDNAAYHQAAWIELCQRLGKPITPAYYTTHIHARSNELIVTTLFGEDCSPKFIAQVSRQKEQLYRDLYRPVIREIPGLTNLLIALQARGVPCAAASNSPKANVDMVLDLLDIRKYLQAVVDRDQVARGKPHPDLLLTVFNSGKAAGVSTRAVFVVALNSWGIVVDSPRIQGDHELPLRIVAHGLTFVFRSATLTSPADSTHRLPPARFVGGA